MIILKDLVAIIVITAWVLFITLFVHGQIKGWLKTFDQDNSKK